MILIKLFRVFFKIGMFSFGGGYAMIPIIQNEIERFGWINSKEFVDIISIVGMTPGPIAVNLATFVGFRVNGFSGALFSIFGIMIPSFISVIIIFKYFNKFKEHELNLLIFKGIKAVVAGLIASAAVSLSKTSLLKNYNFENFGKNLFNSPLQVLNISAILIMILALIALLKYKLHPVLVIVMSASVGILTHYIL